MHELLLYMTNACAIGTGLFSVAIAWSAVNYLGKKYYIVSMPLSLAITVGSVQSIVLAIRYIAGA